MKKKKAGNGKQQAARRSPVAVAVAVAAAVRRVFVLVLVPIGDGVYGGARDEKHRLKIPLLLSASCRRRQDERRDAIRGQAERQHEPGVRLVVGDL